MQVVRPVARSGWTVVLPVKGGPDGKSRLRATLGANRTDRTAAGGTPDGDTLAAAIAADCLDAVLACPAVARVLVVTADPVVHDQTAAAGGVVVPESVPGAGLLAAVADGAAAAPDGPVAVLLGDLPALRPEDLGEALRAAQEALDGGASMAAVPDADERGTVLLAAAAPAALSPAFGPGSFAEHVRRGAAPLRLALPRLRRDVDTATDLAAALALGCGPRTSRLVAAGTTDTRAGRALDGAAGPLEA